MFRYIIISDKITTVPNPFVIDIRKSLKDVAGDIIYLIHTAERAAEMFSDFNYLDNKLRENIYWFETGDELERIIISHLRAIHAQPEIVIKPSELLFSGDTFYFEKGGIMYLLNNNKLYHADLNILSRIFQQKIDLDYVVESNFIGFDQLKIVMKEIGLIDEMYSEDSYIKFLSRVGLEHYLLLVYAEFWKYKENIKYNIDNRFDNPYENILFAEKYLNDLEYNNIDIDKCIEYNVKHGRLPAKYKFNGFYSTTGRIFCSSENFAPLQNVAASKRDILYAEPGHHFVEFDFKSFEFDILCQILGIPILDDPHTDTYNRLVGVPFENSRAIGKKINYSFIFGMNENRLADVIMLDVPGLPNDFKTTFVEKLASEEIMIKMRKFEEELLKTSRNNIVKNFFGRNIHLKKEYAILNNYIQSTAADFLYNKFRFMSELLRGSNKILLQNHDSILIQISDKDIENTNLFEDILSLLKEPISGIYGRIDYKYGLNWKDMN